jgi:hypothetical protein
MRESGSIYAQNHQKSRFHLCVDKLSYPQSYQHILSKKQVLCVDDEVCVP